MAGLLATPSGIAYSTTKHAVVGLSKSLRPEAKAAGVRVSVLWPGAIRTPILVDGGKFGRLATPLSHEKQRQFWEEMGLISAEELASQTLVAAAKDKATIVIPAKMRIAWWIERLVPGFLTRLAYRNMEAMLSSDSSAP
jgi:short-subunit dehydrogenase